ncbi:MAG: TraB/GumN family protein [Gammaproteobacteria bacterium]|nr:TraB/GumN family protein [Gammaproteobacteria bacterium]MCB1924041.1 TraB/GumN family protein [Gammaproteobacteria bacterium]
MSQSIATRRALGIVLLCCLASRALALGFVYEVSKPGAPVSYLVGTLHSEDPRVIALAKQLDPLLAGIDTLAIEIVPDAVTMLAVAAASMLPPGQDLEQVIGAARFAALRDAAHELGLAIDVLARLKPWAVAVTLGMPASDTGRFFDMELYLAALAHGRETLGLETVAEQLAVFEQISPQTQLAMLDSVIKEADRLPQYLEALTLAYLAGDGDRLAVLVREQDADMPADVLEWLDEIMLRQRNVRMLERSLPLLRERSTMIAVGAMHLIGDSGLVAGLRRHGYRVEAWRGNEGLSSP